MMFDASPKKLGFTFPAEWEKQNSIWLSWPHNRDTWPGKFQPIPKKFAEIVSVITRYEHVNINYVNDEMKEEITELLTDKNVSEISYTLHNIPTNDAWCRDHGPAFVINSETKEKGIIDWGYNALGNKYPPFDLDDEVPTKIGNKLGLSIFYPGIIMEGGSIDVNGEGCLLTTKSCLLNKNRNPNLNQTEIENYLKEFYGQEKILWLEEGIVGDDTDGHIDDIARFVNADTILTVVEKKLEDENYQILQNNLTTLKHMTNDRGRRFNIIELPMPDKLEYKGQRIPASYANFLILNNAVIVPTFKDKNDTLAIKIIQEQFPARKVIGIDCVDLAWGLGTLHCISQQEPAVS